LGTLIARSDLSPPSPQLAALLAPDEAKATFHAAVERRDLKEVSVVELRRR
jgi:hypothetical protein